MRSAVEDICRVAVVRPVSVLDVGSRIVANESFSYSDIFRDSDYRYTGVDIEAGENVDVQLKNPYNWTEIHSDSYDLVISGQVLEHVPMFWKVLEEMYRVTRPGGFIVVIVPSKGAIHQYPIDCYRFNPDGLAALAGWLKLKIWSLTIDSGSYWGDVRLIAQKSDLQPIHAESNSRDAGAITTNVVSIPRTRRTGQILISAIATLIGDHSFMKLVDLRNRLRTRTKEV